MEGKWKQTLSVTSLIYANAPPQFTLRMWALGHECGALDHDRPP